MQIIEFIITPKQNKTKPLPIWEMVEVAGDNVPKIRICPI